MCLLQLLPLSLQMPPSLHLDTLHRLAGSAEARGRHHGWADPTPKEENKRKKKNRRNTTANCKEIDQTLLICQKKAP